MKNKTAVAQDTDLVTRGTDPFVLARRFKRKAEG
jgi:hypothetical protein